MVQAESREHEGRLQNLRIVRNGTSEPILAFAVVFAILLVAAIALASVGAVFSWLGSALGGVFQSWASGFIFLAVLVVLVPLVIYLASNS